MGVNIHTIKDIRFYLANELEEICEEQEIFALTNIIIKTVIGVTKLHGLYLTNQPVTVGQSERVIDICKELKTGKPIQYIFGETIFYDCMIKVDEATLIPRPETEELVDLIITENRGSRRKIFDIGTGSGCIAIALAANMPGSEITGIDISRDAIMIAKKNALLNNVNVSFVLGDILNFDFKIANSPEIIVSNPPYVRISEKQFMKRNILDFEPHSSLFVHDNDPLIYYKAILKVADIILTDGGRLYFEINEAMGIPMFLLLEQYSYSEVEIVKDINSKERIIKGIKNVRK